MYPSNSLCRSGKPYGANPTPRPQVKPPQANPQVGIVHLFGIGQRPIVSIRYCLNLFFIYVKYQSINVTKLKNSTYESLGNN